MLVQKVRDQKQSSGDVAEVEAVLLQDDVPSRLVVCKDHLALQSHSTPQTTRGRGKRTES